MSAVSGDPLSLGREALSARQWGRAYELLSTAGEERALPPPDLERLSDAARWTRRYDEMLEVLERAEAGPATIGSVLTRRRAGTYDPIQRCCSWTP